MSLRPTTAVRSCVVTLAACVGLGSAACTSGSEGRSGADVTSASDVPSDAPATSGAGAPTGPIQPGAAAPSAAPGTGAETSGAGIDGVLAPVGTPNPLGARWNWFRYETDGFGQAVRDLAGGSTWIELVWCDVAGQPAALNWTIPDRAFSEAIELGYTLAFKLRTGSCALTVDPASDVDPRRASSSPPVDTDSYLAFVREAVTRYSSQRVHLWAIENEIDAANAWMGTDGEYAALARAVVPVVREADPQAVVADAGVSSVVYGIAVAASRIDDGDPAGALGWFQEFSRRRAEGGGYRFGVASTSDELSALLAAPDAVRALDALDAILALHAENLFDVYQLHWYDPWTLLADALGFVREQLPTGRPVEAWEVGVAWPGPGYDPDEHALDTVRLVAVLLANGVQRVIYLPVFQTEGSRLQPVEIWRGLYEPDARPRPAAAVYETLTRLSAGDDVSFEPIAADPDPDAAREDGLSGLVIGRPDTTAFVVWSDTDLDLDLPEGWLHADPSGGPAPSTITSTPSIIWADQPAPPAIVALHESVR